MKKFLPNKIYLASKSWLGVYSRLKKNKHGERDVYIEVKVTPDLFSHLGEGSCAIARAEERGYLVMKASRMEDGNVRLSALTDQNMGDEDGFGVEPNEYLVATVTPDGTFIEPLHFI